MNDYEGFILQPKLPFTEVETLGPLVDELRRDLHISRSATEALQNMAQLDRDRYAMELNERARIILDLTARHSDQMSAARRCAGQLVEVLRVLRRLHEVTGTIHNCTECIEDVAAFARARNAAGEILTLLDFPF